MIHSAEDITGYFLSHGHPEDYEHAEVKHGFVLCFKDKPIVSLDTIEKKVRAVIEQDVPISFHDEEHISIGDVIYRCTAPRNHVRSAGEIEGFTLIKDIPYDPVRKCYLIVGLLGRRKLRRSARTLIRSSGFTKGYPLRLSVYPERLHRQGAAFSFRE